MAINRTYLGDKLISIEINNSQTNDCENMEKWINDLFQIFTQDDINQFIKDYPDLFAVISRIFQG
jgi:hypothetical protein